MLKKSEIKTWRTAVAQGELFTVNLADQDGTEILGSFLSGQVAKFYPIIEVNKEYIVTKGTIKMANKRVTTIQNDFCITFHDDTEFIEISSDLEESSYQTDFEKSLIRDNTKSDNSGKYEK